VIESEGEKRAAINVAEGEKAAVVLASEATAAEVYKKTSFPK
jgi:regulator of protease activity HflC (stomatin/prohibitin superfamily)